MSLTKMAETMEYEVRYALRANPGESTRSAARRMALALEEARHDLTAIWEHFGASREHGALEQMVALDQENAEMRKAFAILSDEVGLPKGDYLGVVRAVKSREGAGGILSSLRAKLGKLSLGRPSNEDVCTLVDVLIDRARDGGQRAAELEERMKMLGLRLNEVVHCICVADVDAKAELIAGTLKSIKIQIVDAMREAELAP